MRWLILSVVAGCLSIGSGCGGGSVPQLPPPPPSPPIIASISPGNCSVGSPALTITASGENFISSSLVEWDGTSLPTTYLSSTSLTAQVSASDLAQSGAHKVTVANSANAGGISNAKTFIVIALSGTRIATVDVQASDIVWDPVYKRIYATIPSTASNNPNSIAVIDPTLATVVSSQAAGQEPDRIAISDNSQYLYASLDGTGSIQRFLLPNLSPDISISLGQNPPYGPYQATGLAVAPGAPHTVAVGKGTTPVQGGLGVIYDDANPRANNYSGAQVQWGANQSSLCAEGYGYGGGQVSCYDVGTSGASLRNEFMEIGLLGGLYVHFDPGTGYLYADGGAVSDPVSGNQLGMYYPNLQMASHSNSPGVNVLLPDSQHNRVFILGQTPEQVAAGDFTLEAFDQQHFTSIASIVIPAVGGAATHLIRWGKAGLAFSTTSGLPCPCVPEKLYLIDGSFVDDTVAADSAAGVDYGPVPLLATMTPQVATAGSGTIALDLTGDGFTSGSVVQWNGQALSTTFLSSTSLQAQVPASDLVSPSAVPITVWNPSTAASVSSPLIFSVFPPQSSGNSIGAINLAGQDLAWDPAAGKLYVAVLSADPKYGNSIAVVDPVTSTVVSGSYAGSEPMLVRVGSPSLAYAGFMGSSTVQEFSLPDFTPGVSWGLGSDPIFGTPFFAFDLQVAPGAPHTTAISIADWYSLLTEPKELAIYDDNVQRPTVALSTGTPIQYTFLQWGASPSTLYAIDMESAPTNAFYKLAVDASGVSLTNTFPLTYNNDYRIHFDPGTGYIYNDNGEIIDPSDGSVIHTLPASGYVVPDSSVNRIFVLGQTFSQTGTYGATIEAFDQTTLDAVGSVTIPNIAGAPANFIRWGTSGLAFSTVNGTFLAGFEAAYLPGGGMLYVIDVAGLTTAKGASTVPVEHVHRTWKVPVLPRVP